MKHLLIILLFALITSCSKDTSTPQIRFKGTIGVQGFTTFQYGTHLISNQKTFYTLKSQTINLNNYLNQTVTISGNFVEGYPIDGGPEFVDVICVQIN